MFAFLHKSGELCNGCGKKSGCFFAIVDFYNTFVAK